MTSIVDDKSESIESIERVSQSSTPPASSSDSGNSMSCKGSSILSARAVLRSSR